MMEGDPLTVSFYHSDARMILNGCFNKVLYGPEVCHQCVSNPEHLDLKENGYVTRGGKCCQNSFCLSLEKLSTLK